MQIQTEHEFVEEVKFFAQSQSVKRLLDQLEDRFVSDWRNSVPIGIDTREHCYRMVQAIQALKGELERVAQGDKIAIYNNRLRGKLT